MSRLLLQGSGYEVVTARDGEEAVNTAATERPDLIMLDVHMPKLDGYEVCRRLRARADTSLTPIIMCTTCCGPSDQQIGYKMGCSDYLPKPYERDGLLAKIRAHLG